MNKPANLIQLYKDLVRLVIRAQQLLLEEAIKEFLVECEKVYLQEAEIIFPLNYTNFLKEIEEYAKELDWNIDNNKQSLFNNAQALKKTALYRKRSLSGLKVLREDRDSIKSPGKRQHLSNLLERFVLLFNQLFRSIRDEIRSTFIASRTDWVELYDLTDISIDQL